MKRIDSHLDLCLRLYWLRKETQSHKSNQEESTFWVEMNYYQFLSTHFPRFYLYSQELITILGESEIAESVVKVKAFCFRGESGDEIRLTRSLFGNGTNQICTRFWPPFESGRETSRNMTRLYLTRSLSWIMSSGNEMKFQIEKKSQNSDSIINPSISPPLFNSCFFLLEGPLKYFIATLFN